MKEQTMIDEMENRKEWFWTSLRNLSWAEKDSEDDEVAEVFALVFCYSTYSFMPPVLYEVQLFYKQKFKHCIHQLPWDLEK